MQRRSLLATPALLLGAPASAQGTRTLSIGVAAPVTTMDPHFHDAAPNKGLASHIFDGLTDLDERSRVIPALAESWERVEDKRWRFRLRRGVRFHDGQDFTAEDVVASIARTGRVPNAIAPFTTYTRSIETVRVIDPHTVEIVTKVVEPLTPGNMAQVKILPRRIAESATTEEFNRGTAAIGTGPFRLVSHAQSAVTELARHEGYWGEKPHWERVSYRPITGAGPRMAALLAGDVQLVDAVPSGDLERLRGERDVAISETVGLRLIYLWLDRRSAERTAAITGPNGEALARNPLDDRRVRQALSISINRQAIVDRILQGAAVPTGQFMPPGGVSHDPARPVIGFAPDRARALLAEAGYPNGLRLTLNGPTDRYLNGGQVMQAIGQMWQRVGIRTSVEPQPWNLFAGRLNQGNYSVALGGVGNASGDSSLALRIVAASFAPDRGFGTLNYGRYSNPSLDALIERAVSEPDDTRREALLREAVGAAMDDVALIPLHIQKNIWATRRGLTYTARADEQTRAWLVRPGAA
ncbi:ABC transporter substrate-binding protein [Roseococcus sp. SYP-B2431]|uniref:ABC transporter substrate-binding protein n=1 Tax=Roseococcus sp. SYP-B2431 TaxID=2496640 RepID=UPI001F0F4500|nr:ABC transporter substrate-binding protein [Roseococcus sp. SYP-B2431]